MTGGKAEFAQGDLELLSFSDGMLREQMVYGYIVAEEGQTVDQFESLLSQRTCLSYAVDAHGCLMDQLQCETRVYIFSGAVGPTTQQIPGAQSHVLGHQKPKSHEAAGDLVGQELPDAAFDTLGVARLKSRPKQGALCRDHLLWCRAVLVEFFFEGRSLQ